MDDRLLRLTNSLNKGQFYSLLTGKDGYGYIHRLADMPTDPEKVFDSIIRYYELNKNQPIWTLFEDCLSLMCDDPEDVWLVIYYISCFLFYRRYTGNDLLDLKTIGSRFKLGVKKYEMELSKNSNWGGGQWPNGLMGDVNRMLNNLKDEFDFRLANEDSGAL